MIRRLSCTFGMSFFLIMTLIARPAIADVRVLNGNELRRHLNVGSDYWVLGGCIRGDEKQGLECFGPARARIDGFAPEGIPLITVLTGSNKGINNSCLRSRSASECDDNSRWLEVVLGYPNAGRKAFSLSNGRLGVIKRPQNRPNTCVSARMLDIGHGDFKEDFLAGQDFNNTTAASYSDSFNSYFFDKTHPPLRNRFSGKSHDDGIVGLAEAYKEYAEAVNDVAERMLSAFNDPACDLRGGEQVIIYGEEEVLHRGFQGYSKTLLVGRVVGHIDAHRNRDILSEYIVYIDPADVE